MHKARRKYLPKEIEKSWQDIWTKNSTYSFRLEKDKKPYYTLVELPYPSGNLHIGHWFTFATADAHARHMRMAGRNVFFPNGFDAFGLPAENAAIKRGVHPKDWTMSNIETMRKQFDSMGSMIDWSHQAITCLPEYYRWNQWIFIKMFERGLAYRGKTLSNWCPSCQTVLANEGIEDGKCWRCGSIVEQKEIEQWFLKITAYADRLLWDNTTEKLANGVDWPRSVREGQNNWIGRSEGALIEFKVLASLRSGHSSKSKVEVFTTRPDTLFGATFLVVAPEHPVVASLLNAKFKIQNAKLQEVRDYIKQAKNKTEMERKEQKEKTGVFTGIFAINPVTNEEIPVWVADYVLWGYGTGAIMAVPAHDPRDWEFAKKYSLPIRRVIAEKDQVSSIKYLVSGKNGNIQNTKYKILNTEMEKPYAGEGILINSGKFDGQSTEQARQNITKYLKSVSLGEQKIQYHLHDWSVSRQRYWGTPVPIIYCRSCWEVKSLASRRSGQKSKVKSEYGRDYTEIEGIKHAIIPVPLEDLPVELPYEVDYTPKGKPPLATAEAWMNVACPKCGGKAKRDPETLDTFFDSSWYFYRYLDPKYDKEPFNPELAEGLSPVDIYFGGAEHTLGHTLYARFFTKFFHDIGLLEYEEFAKKRIQHGVILGPDGFRMSKSRGNVIDPDDVVREYGADTVRLFLCFMMPYEATAPWNPAAISGIYRFLRRIWDLSDKVQSARLAAKRAKFKVLASRRSGQSSKDDLVFMHRTIKKVGEDIEAIHMNTAIATLMEWLNYLSAKNSVSVIEYKTLLLLLAPFAPHITEELWQGLKINDLRFKNDKEETIHKSSIVNHKSFDSIHLQSWPQYNPQYLQSDTIQIVVQVNGRVRENLTVAAALRDDKDAIAKKAQELDNVKKHIDAKPIKTVVYVPGRIINFVI